MNIKKQGVLNGVNILEQKLYNGVFGSIPQNNWTGNDFSHNHISSVGAGYVLNSLIEDQGGNTIVGSVGHGYGKIIYAGPRGINFQGGTNNYDADVLWNNLIAYSIELSAIPKPSTNVLILGSVVNWGDSSMGGD